MLMIGARNYQRDEYGSYGLQNINSPEFPSLVAAFSPDAKNMLEKVTSIDNVYRVHKFKHAGTEAKFSYNSEQQKHDRVWAQEIFSKVDLEIRVLMSYTNDAHHRHHMLHSYSETDCPYCLAYSVWNHLSRAKITESPEEGINPKFGKDLWRFNDVLEWSPEGASPHFYLSNTKFQMQWEREHDRNAPRVDVPLHISKRIYRLLLWKSFENICLFLLHRARLTNFLPTGYTS